MPHNARTEECLLNAPRTWCVQRQFEEPFYTSGVHDAANATRRERATKAANAGTRNAQRYAQPALSAARAANHVAKV